ncbi:MAG: protein kinase [Pseudomonadota bacterium]
MTSLYIDAISAPPPIKAHLLVLSKNIHFEKEDSKAGNGYVFFGKNKVTKVDVTVKFYYWGGDQAFHAEPKQLAAINSANVLAIHDAGLLDENWAYFLTPTCANGDLDDLLDQTSIGNHAALDFTSEILTGVNHLHAQRFLHRDLKPANVYVNAAHSAVIGDFGSVRRIPEGSAAIPASRHSLLYRPPETFLLAEYGFTGDIYQCGIIMFQLLGGYLPYEAMSYMNKKQQLQLAKITDAADASIYIDSCVKELICAGKLLDYNMMPPWVPDNLKKILKKACHIDPSKRFQSPAAFMAKIHEVRPSILNWRVVDACPTLDGKLSYRVLTSGESATVQKRKAGPWRNDNAFGVATLHQQVGAISDVVQAT